METRDSEEDEFSRISLSLASLGIIGTLNAIQYLLGYGGVFQISAEFALAVLAFTVLLQALLPSGYKLPHFRASLVIFVLFYLIAQLLIQTMTSTGYDSLIRVIVPLAIAGVFLYTFRGRLTHMPHFAGFRFNWWIKALSFSIFMFILILYFYKVSLPSSDEFTIDWYSSIQFLSGLDPYINSVTAGVFKALPIPVTAMTPNMAGGYVTNLSYPSLSFLLLVPARLLRISPFIGLIPLYIIPLAFIKRNVNILSGTAISAAFIIQPLLLTQYSLGFSDIFWMTLTALSLICLQKSYLSGALMGSALSLKQVPLLLYPFMLILIARRYGMRESIKFIFSSVVAFTVFNGYFILKSPYAYVHDMLAPEIQNLIGIGFGPSQYSFLGFIDVTRDFYTFMVIFLLIFFIVIYIIYTDRIQYGFLAFPILIFIFNYRSLAEYLMYWPMMAVLLIPFLASRELKVRESQTKTIRFSRNKLRKIAVFAVVLIAVPVAASIHFERAPSLRVNSIVPQYYSNGTLSYMEANVTYLGQQNSVNPLYFRFVGGAPMVNQNGYIWGTEGNVSLRVGITCTFELHPLAESDLINVTGTYSVIVYYEHDLGESSKKISIHE